MHKTSDRLCKSCIYSKNMQAGTLIVCDYFLMTNKMRGCKVGECDKYEKGKTRNSSNKIIKILQEDKQ